MSRRFGTSRASPAGAASRGRHQRRGTVVAAAGCRRIGAVVVLAAVAAGVGAPGTGMASPPASNGDGDLGALRRWLEEQIRPDASLPVFGAVRFEYRLQVPATETPEQVDQWRAEVEGFPDHPLRQSIEVQARRLARGPDTERHSLWLLGPTQWRLCNSIDYLPDVPYADAARDGATAWMVAGAVLKVTGGADDSIASGAEASRTREHLGYLLRGGLHLAAMGGAGTRLEQVSLRDGRWTATVRNDGHWRVHAQGRWDRSLGRGFPGRVEQVNPQLPEPHDREEVRVLDWTLDPVLGRWVARRVESFDARGRLIQVLAFEGAAPEDEAVVRSLLAAPDPLGNDPVRGPLTTVKRVYDHRPDRRTFTNLTESGPVSHPMAPEDPRATELSEAAARRLQVAGWVTAGVLAAALVGLRLMRATRDRQENR